MHSRAKNEKPSKIPRMLSQTLGVMLCRAGESPEVSDVISQIWPAPISYAGVALIEGGFGEGNAQLWEWTKLGRGGAVTAAAATANRCP